MSPCAVGSTAVSRPTPGPCSGSWPIIEKINADVQQIVNDPEFHKRFLEPYVVQPLPGPLDALAAYLRKDSERWAKVIKAANVKID